MKLTNQLITVSAKGLHPSPHQNRNMRAADLTKLIESVKLHGVLEPVLARRVGSKLVLIAGERRTRAAKAAKVEVPVRVLEATEEQAAAITIEENLQREDLTPFEEAKGVATLLKFHDHDNAAVAERLGRSPGWVARRAGLLKLSPRWKDAVSDRDHKFSTWGAGSLSYISRFEPEVQDELIESLQGWNGRLHMTEQQVRKATEAYLRQLSSAPWDLTREFENLRTCEGCPRRTDAQPELFDEHAGTARCTDALCWTRKSAVLVTEHLEDGAKPITAHDGFEEPVVDVGIDSWELPSIASVKEKKGGVPYVLVTGPTAGKLVHIDPKSVSAVRGSSTPKRKKGVPAPLKERREKLHLRRLKRICDRIHEWLTGNPADCPMDHERLFRLVTGFGVDAGRIDGTGIYQERLTILKWANRKQKTADTVAWDSLRLKLADEFRWEMLRHRQPEEELKLLAKQLGMKWTFHWKEAVDAIPEPKLWSLLKDDGTPKAKS